MKQTKTLIILVALLAILGIGYLAVSNLTPDEDPVVGTDTDDSTIALTDFDYETVDRIEYTAGGDYYLLEKVNTVWYWAEDHALPLRQEAVLQMANAAGSLSALRTVEGSPTEESYGLSLPSHEIKITLADGSTTELAVGSYNSFAGGYYLAYEGNVYIVSKDFVTFFGFAPIDMIKLDSLPSISDAASIQSVLLDATEMTDETRLAAFYEAYASLRTTSLVDYNAEEDELVAYGLDESTRTTLVVHYTEKIEVTDTNQSINSSITKDHTLTLRIGASIDDRVCFSFDDSAMVFTAEQSIMQALLDAFLAE